MRRGMYAIAGPLVLTVLVLITVQGSSGRRSTPNPVSVRQAGVLQRAKQPLRSLPPHPENHSRRFVEGRSTPTDIPVDSAYRTFFRAVASLKANGDEGRYRSYVQYAMSRGFALARDARSISLPDARPSLPVGLDPAVRRTGDQFRALVEATLDRGIRPEALSREGWQVQLREELGPEGAEAIDQFVLKVVRARMKLIY
jgi:hypothetical protein